jgi:hypothetical protein
MGYSPGFIKNFKRVIRGFTSNPDSAIILTTETDIICSACPHNKNGRCSKKENSEKRTKEHDLKAIKRFGFREGERIKISEALDKIKKEILPKNLAKICQKCDWLGYCSNLPNFNQL